MQISDIPSSMRTQRQGFTLVEIMIVIAIIVILASISLQFNANDQVAKKNSERFVTAVQNVVDAQKLASSVGRSINIGTAANPNIIFPALIRVTISTGSLSAVYMSGSCAAANGLVTCSSGPAVMSTGAALSYPYYNDKKYSILARGLVRWDGTGTGLAPTDTLWIDFLGGEAYFSGSNAAALSGAVGLQVVVNYGSQAEGFRSVMDWDKRSGRIASYVGRYPGCVMPDVTLGNGQVWASCNIQWGGKGCGPNGCGSEFDPKNFFQWGWSDGSWVTSRPYSGSEPEGRGFWSPGAQGPCALGYHVPTEAEFEISDIGPRLPISGYR